MSRASKPARLAPSSLAFIANCVVAENNGKVVRIERRPGHVVQLDRAVGYLTARPATAWIVSTMGSPLLTSPGRIPVESLVAQQCILVPLGKAGDFAADEGVTAGSKRRKAVHP